jgi:hypothetical protein
MMALRQTIEEELARLMSDRDEMERSLASQMEAITSLRGEAQATQDRLDRLHSEIEARLSRSESAGQHMRRVSERIGELQARLEAVVRHFEAERDRVELSSTQIKQLLARVAPKESVPVRGRLIRTPARPTVTIEFVAASGLDWRPATTATVAGRSAAVVETGTTRPGPIAAESLVRVEIVAAFDDVRRARSLEIESGDTVLSIALATAE